MQNTGLVPVLMLVGPILLKFIDQDSEAGSIHVTGMNTEKQTTQSCLGPKLFSGIRKGQELTFQIDMPQPDTISGIIRYSTVVSKLAHRLK